VSLREALGAALGREVQALERVAGGSINAAWRATLDDGAVVFVKAHDAMAPGAFAAEASGLVWLRAAPDGPGVPRVLAHADGWLALEWVETGGGALDEERLGRELAAMHRAGAPGFGARDPLRFDWLTLPNDPAPTWAAFYAERRLGPLAALAAERDALPAGTVALLDRVAARLPGLAGPDEPPARAHGDLWSGNVIPGPGGRPFLVDPVAHGAHRELDLAMLRLFGGPSERAFSAYAEAFPLADGHAERVGLWQLAPLLVHAVLFGGGYGASVARTAARYA
jgi:fructosamine-3-kinase